jgi:SHS2 domain-containing protein
MGRWRVVEDVALADCALDLEGRDLGDLFETAALALAELMVDPATVPVTVTREVTLEDAEVDLLLYDFLSELIFLKDRDREVYPRCRVHVDGEGPFRLRARLEGGVIDPEHTARRADPKAVTLHQFRLEPVPGGWRARLVIDI